MIPDPCSTYWRPGGKKNDYETNHASWNQYDTLYPTILFPEDKKALHQFYSAQEEICSGTVWITTTLITVSKYNEGKHDTLRKIL